MRSDHRRDYVAHLLAELRAQLELWRSRKRDTRRRPWGWWPSAERERHKALAECTRHIREVEQRLRDLIRAYRPLMGPEWPGSEHGRLCWARYSHHSCELPEGHAGFHEDFLGAWPRQVTNHGDWLRLMASCRHPERVEWGRKIVCAVCGTREPQMAASGATTEERS